MNPKFSYALVLSLSLSASLSAAEPVPQESVYAPPSPVAENEGVNAGGFHFDLAVAYATDYVYRGVNHSNKATGLENDGSLTNFQVDAKMSFDLGKLPHPFVELFANIWDSDPVSKFQEIRPTIGADWELRPLTLTGGWITYIYPEREDLDAGEVFGKVVLNDSTLFKSDGPVLSPYVMGAYEYGINGGWYFETGVSHDFKFEDIGLTLTPIARIAYTSQIQHAFAFSTTESGSGAQHYDIGLEAKYALNKLLNVSQRWGEWSMRGFVFHTEHLSDSTIGDSVTWGGFGLNFAY